MDGDRQETWSRGIDIKENKLDVHAGGRIRIPGPIRDTFGLEKPDLLSATIHFENGDGEMVTEDFSNPLGETGRVTIPARIRNEHGIEDGDTVDLTIKKVIRQ